MNYRAEYRLEKTKVKNKKTKISVVKYSLLLTIRRPDFIFLISKQIKNKLLWQHLNLTIWQLFWPLRHRVQCLRSAVAFRLSASEKTFPIVAFIAILNKLSNICAKKGLKYVTFV